MTSPEHSYRDEETLRDLYHERGMTTREIADALDTTNGTISKWLNRHGIETRENWKAGVEAAAEANRVERVKMRTLHEKHPYECWATKVRENGERVNKICYVHRLLAVAEYGFDPVADMDIHHANGIPWDNRPGNVGPVNKSDHGEYHTNQRWENDPEPLEFPSPVADTESAQATLDAFGSGGASA